MSDPTGMSLLCGPYSFILYVAAPPSTLHVSLQAGFRLYNHR
jgi:hypothetical protein